MKMESGGNPKSKIQNAKAVVGMLTMVCAACALGPRVLAADGVTATQEAGGPAKLTFTKVLPGSIPEFEEITVDSNGSATYDGRKLSEPHAPRTIKLSPATTQSLFA